MMADTEGTNYTQLWLAKTGITDDPGRREQKAPARATSLRLITTGPA
jgi:hypothetical protein